MSVERRAMSVSMFSELLGLVPAQFRGVAYDQRTSSVTLVLEPEETDVADEVVVGTRAGRPRGHSLVTRVVRPRGHNHHERGK